MRCSKLNLYMNCVDLTSEFTFEAEEDATVRLQQIDAELHEVNEILVIHPIKFRQIMIAITWCIVLVFHGDQFVGIEQKWPGRVDGGSKLY